MIVELLCRFSKELSKAEQDIIDKELEIQSIIKGSDFDYKEAKERLLEHKPLFDYEPMTLNLKDIFIFNYVDKKHTCLRFYNGNSFTFKISYLEFKALYQTLAGTIINDFTQNLDILTNNNKNG